jgi:predicted dehydrogenase
LRLLKVCIVGFGRRGLYYFRKLQDRTDSRVVAVCEVRGGMLPLLPNQDIRLYSDYDSMLEHEKMDFLIVATPPRSHRDIVVKALLSGFHVLCEKPLAWDLVDAWDIVRAVEKTGLFCEVGYQLRHHPGLSRASSALRDSGIALVRGHYYHSIPLVDSIRDKTTGGGQVFDQLTHLIDLGRLFAGEITTVFARYTLNARERCEMNNWDGYSLTTEFQSGAVGSFASTYALFLGHGDLPTLDVVGRDTLVRLEGDRLLIAKPDLTEVYGGLHGGFDADHDIVGSFIDAICSGRPEKIKSPPADAMNTLAACIAANLSARAGVPVSTSDILERAAIGERISVT